jgi:hypothetical protein
MTNEAVAGLPGAHANNTQELFSSHLAEYLDDLSDVDASQAEKIELLEVLWSIMTQFVHLGFSVDLCGQLVAGFNRASMPPDQDVELDLPERGDASGTKEENDD